MRLRWIAFGVVASVGLGCSFGGGAGPGGSPDAAMIDASTDGEVLPNDCSSGLNPRDIEVELGTICTEDSNGSRTVTGSSPFHLDTDTGIMRDASGVEQPLLSNLATMGVVVVRVAYFDLFTLDVDLRVTGSLPLVIASSGKLKVTREIDIGSGAGLGIDADGGGANPDQCEPEGGLGGSGLLSSGNVGGGGGGGGLGSFGGMGADGIGPNAIGAAGGGVVTSSGLTFRGGCAGGGSGANTAGGSGGGALYLWSGVGNVEITGTINAGGAGGAGGVGTLGGSGGGAGGVVVLEASYVKLTGAIAANGGGGGGGGAIVTDGNPGARGLLAASPALGGLGAGGSNGGTGAFGQTGAGGGSTPGMFNGGGGAGGGGTGFIIVYSKSRTFGAGGTTSPPVIEP